MCTDPIIVSLYRGTDSVRISMYRPNNSVSIEELVLVRISMYRPNNSVSIEELRHALIPFEVTVYLNFIGVSYARSL